VSFDSQLLAKENFEMQAGKVNYIRFSVDVERYEPFVFSSGAVFTHRIASVPREEALAVLNECPLIEVPGNTKGYIEIGK
jgi:hypothetical protein